MGRATDSALARVPVLGWESGKALARVMVRGLVPVWALEPTHLP